MMLTVYKTCQVSHFNVDFGPQSYNLHCIGVNYRICWRISGVVYMESTLVSLPAKA
jgi:hypothetical protein